MCLCKKSISLQPVNVNTDFSFFCVQNVVKLLRFYGVYGASGSRLLHCVHTTVAVAHYRGTVTVHFKNLRTNTCAQSASDTFFRYFYLHFPSPFAIGCFTYIVHLFEQNKHVFSKRYKKMWLQYKKRQLFENCNRLRFKLHASTFFEIHRTKATLPTVQVFSCCFLCKAKLNLFTQTDAKTRFTHCYRLFSARISVTLVVFCQTLPLMRPQPLFLRR